MLSGSILVAAVGLGTTLAILFWPSKTAPWLLLLAPILWAFGAADIYSKESAPPNVAVAVSGAATLMYARFLVLRYRNPEFYRLQMASIAYCVAILPSVFVSASPMESFKGYLRLVSPIIFMFALLRGSRARGVHVFPFKALALAAVSLLGVIVAAQYAGEGSYAMGGFDRLRAFNLWPHTISEYSVGAVGVLICGVLLSKHRYVYATGILALIVCTYLTGFRTAWVGMAVLIGLVMVIAVQSGIAQFIALIAALSLFSVGGVLKQSLVRYAHDDEVMSLDAVTSGRITTDTIALNRYLSGTPAEWVFGIGVNSSEQATLDEEGTGWGVHSDFLATLIECGVVGLVAYLSLLFVMGRILFRMMRSFPRQHPARTFAAVGFASFVAFAVMGIPGALYTNVFVGWYFYGFIGFVLAQLKTANPTLKQVFSISHGPDRSSISAQPISAV